MTSASMTFGRTHAAHPMPRGAILAGVVVGWLIKAVHAVDQWLLDARRPAGPETAEEVLVWASRIEASDPGFAADLRAAVARADSDQ